MSPVQRFWPMLMAGLIGGAALAAPFAVASVSAAPRGEDARRLAAEIVVMQADTARLSGPGLQELHRRGLKARLGGGLALLPLLIRAARRDVPSWPAPDRGLIDGLRRALEADKAADLAAGLARLAETYPFNTAGLLPPDTRPRALAAAGAVHENYCAGCHDEPDTEVPRPAWSLYELGRKAPPRELAARLVIGVRGQNLTAMDNPLKDSEISGLIAYYRRGAPDEN